MWEIEDSWTCLVDLTFVGLLQNAQNLFNFVMTTQNLEALLYVGIGIPEYCPG